MENYISIFISIIAVTFTALTYYRKFFYEKSCIEMTVCNFKVDENKLIVIVLFNNLGNQVATITNCCINLKLENTGFDSPNEKANHSWIEPFSLSEGNQKSLTISYDIPELNDNTEARINVMSNNAKGVVFSDFFIIGEINSNEKAKNIPYIEHVQHQLFKRQILISIHK